MRVAAVANFRFLPISELKPRLTRQRSAGRLQKPTRNSSRLSSSQSTSALPRPQPAVDELPEPQPAATAVSQLPKPSSQEFTASSQPQIVAPVAVKPMPGRVLVNAGSKADAKKLGADEVSVAIEFYVYF